MADVRGLPVAEAKQVLVDLSLGVVAVSVQETPSVGAPGTVVSQNPPAGQPASASVTLVVAAPAVIPAVVGVPVSRASRDLEQLGAQVLVQRVYRPGSTVDVVLEVQPAAGQPATGTVTLVAAAPPAAVYLSDLRPVKGSCSQTEASVNGTKYRHALRCNSSATASDVDFLLNRRTSHLEGTVGQADTGDPGRAIKVEVLGDGRALFTAQVAYGQAATVSVNTTGVLRLTLRVTVLNFSTTTSNSVSTVFGDLRVIGGPADVASLTEPKR